MANKRHGHEPTGRCAEAEDCAAVAVHRLSQERVDELAEEIWTASGAGRRNRRWRVRVVIISALGSGLLVGLTAGDGLGWRMAVLVAWAAAAPICSLRTPAAVLDHRAATGKLAALAALAAQWTMSNRPATTTQNHSHPVRGSSPPFGMRRPAQGNPRTKEGGPTSPGANEIARRADEGRPSPGSTRSPDELTSIR
jgi:hypothetical protein